ncbi:hypothetical protein GGX14DRAFT_402631 [Mycena pura]|uniref:Uncharacterized protein n=1 Tax=Mycena pura TaxID=153505 RepID=A0AAD6V4X3_9AGAR|nr:hypothetical protein GGX14DRAFT_402631 [Mycena pura]
MSTTDYNATPLVTSRTGVESMSKQSSPSSADWLGPSLLTAKAITAAAENAPVPFVKGIFGTILVVLETIQKVRKNRDSLKELCEKIMEIMKALEGHLDSDPATDTMKLEILCEDLQRCLLILTP